MRANWNKFGTGNKLQQTDDIKARGAIFVCFGDAEDLASLAS